MITTAKVVGYDGNTLIVIPNEDIDREMLKKQINQIEIHLSDGRSISTDQRKKIFAVIRDISIWCGHEPEYLRQLLTWAFVSDNGGEVFSLKTVDMTTAREFLNYLINFCFTYDVPTKKPLIEHAEEIGKYLYMCLEHRKCAVCNQRAEVHHIDTVGMGADRRRINHVGKRAVALCHAHHMQAHRQGQAFLDKYKIFGIKLDEYLVKILI